MPGVVEGYVKRNNAIRKERLRNVLRKDPYCETKLLTGRFRFSANIVHTVRNEVFKELKLKTLDTPYLSGRDMQKISTSSYQWFPMNKKDIKKRDVS